ncbi:NAD(P)H-hydrate dehydratase [Clostridium sp.]|uniref:NAD(P)H-hydrate dehydratase n=1 Tax=Clostridium sp. TaxID=1506 RepID=UPI002FC8F110
MIYGENNIIGQYRLNKQIRLRKQYPLNILRKRDRDSNKGSFGKVCIIGGSDSMPGAVILAAKGALASGAGLVNCCIPKCILDRVSSNVYESTFTPLNSSNGTIILEEKDLNLIIDKYDSVSIGVGLSNSEYLLSAIRYLVSNYTKGFVIDADGLNLLSRDVNILKNSKSKDIVLTPHPLEMKRLTGLSVEYINSNRAQVALNFAKENNCILLLKGQGTVVTDGSNIYINKSGNPGMATGGSGDVLTGIITSLLAQGYGGYNSAVLGSFLHGLSGDAAYKVYGNGLTPTDITKYIGEYVK